MRLGITIRSSRSTALIFPSWCARPIDAATPTRGRTNLTRPTRLRRLPRPRCSLRRCASAARSSRVHAAGAVIAMSAVTVNEAGRRAVYPGLGNLDAEHRRELDGRAVSQAGDADARDGRGAACDFSRRQGHDGGREGQDKRLSASTRRLRIRRKSTSGRKAPRCCDWRARLATA